MRLGHAALDFRCADWFDLPSSTGYETLLYVGDQSLFQRADTLGAGWAAVQPILDAWGADRVSLTSGPRAANELLERDDRHWLPLL
jgi:glucose-6-phosphate 1-dehydrogenase